MCFCHGLIDGSLRHIMFNFGVNRVFWTIMAVGHRKSNPVNALSDFI